MTRSVTVSGAACVVGALGLALGAVRDPTRAILAYVTAWSWAAALATGALLLTASCEVSASEWFVALRPLARRVTDALPAVALLAAPPVVWARALYPWAADPAAPYAARAWLSLGFFSARVALYVAAWALLAWAFSRARTEAGRRALGAAAAPVVVLTATFAAVDLFMSLTPDWRSTVYGLAWLSGGFAGAVALVAALLPTARRAGAIPAEVGAEHSHALGTTLFAALAMWAYLALSQFFLIWITDLPEEATWYLARSRGPWGPWATALLVGHLVLPMAALLSRAVKRRPRRLAAVGAWVLLMRPLDAEWEVVPSLREGRLAPALVDLAAFLAVGGAAVAFASWRASRAPEAPTDPELLRASLRYEAP